MQTWQAQTILIWGIFNIFLGTRGFYESWKRKNAFGLIPYFSFTGAYVWGDAVIFGLFWSLVSLLCLILKDWLLFLLFISVFWLVRSIGETIYWFLQQFSSLVRNPPEKLLGFRFFHNDSIWFIYQICMQCVTVTTLISTIYISKLWLDSLF
jgi:hypothetical protein